MRLSVIGDSRGLMRMPKEGAFSLLEEFPLSSRTSTYALPIAWDGQRDQAGKLSARLSPQTLLSCKMTEISFTHGNFHSTPCTNQSSLTNLQFRNCSQLAGAPLPGQLHEKLIKFNGCHFLFQSTFYLKLQEEAINCSVYHGFKKKWKITQENVIHSDLQNQDRSEFHVDRRKILAYCLRILVPILLMGIS